MARPAVSDFAAVGAAIGLWKLYGFEGPSDLILEDMALA
jgi:hypothetical protein